MTLVETGGSRLPSRGLGNCPAGSGNRPSRHFRVNVVDNLAEICVETVARMREGDRGFAGNPSGVRRKNQDAVAHEARLFDIVPDQQHRFCRQPTVVPEIEKVGADRLDGQYIERRKGFVQQ
jgi:hypothetical protein